VAAIQRRIINQGRRHIILRHLHAKNDKEKIAAWRLDLIRILHVFNVRYIASVWLLLTPHFQTELTINTHVTVSEIHHDVVNTHTIVSELEHNVTSTHIMISDIHRTMVKGQEGGNGSNLLVSGTRAEPTTGQYSLLPRLKPGQQPEPPVHSLSYTRD